MKMKKDEDRGKMKERRNSGDKRCLRSANVVGTKIEVDVKIAVGLVCARSQARRSNVSKTRALFST